MQFKKRGGGGVDGKFGNLLLVQLACIPDYSGASHSLEK